jgi:hypothetical protein
VALAGHFPNQRKQKSVESESDVSRAPRTSAAELLSAIGNQGIQRFAGNRQAARAVYAAVHGLGNQTIQRLAKDAVRALAAHAERAEAKPVVQRKIRTKTGQVYATPPKQKTDERFKSMVASKSEYLVRSDEDVTQMRQGTDTFVLAPRKHLIGEEHNRSNFTTAVGMWGWGAGLLLEAYGSHEKLADLAKEEKQESLSSGKFKGGANEKQMWAKATALEDRGAKALTDLVNARIFGAIVLEVANAFKGVSTSKPKRTRRTPVITPSVASTEVKSTPSSSSKQPTSAAVSTPVSTPSVTPTEAKSSSEPSTAAVSTPVVSSSTEAKLPITTPSVATDEAKSSSEPSTVAVSTPVVSSSTETKTPITTPSVATDEAKSSSEPSSAAVSTPVVSSSTETKTPITTPSVASTEAKSTSSPSIKPIEAIDPEALKRQAEKQTKENCDLAWQKGNLALFVARELARYLRESAESPFLGIFGSYFHGHEAVKKAVTAELFGDIGAALDSIKQQYDDPGGVHLSAPKIEKMLQRIDTLIPVLQELVVAYDPNVKLEQVQKATKRAIKGKKIDAMSPLRERYMRRRIEEARIPSLVKIGAAHVQHLRNMSMPANTLGFDSFEEFETKNTFQNADIDP